MDSKAVGDQSDLAAKQICVDHGEASAGGKPAIDQASRCSGDIDGFEEAARGRMLWGACPCSDRVETQMQTNSRWIEL